MLAELVDAPPGGGTGTSASSGVDSGPCKGNAQYLGHTLGSNPRHAIRFAREELAYVLVRLTKIAQERNAREREVLLPGKQKRAARTKKPTNAQEAAAQMGIPYTERTLSA